MQGQRGEHLGQSGRGIGQSAKSRARWHMDQQFQQKYFWISDILYISQRGIKCFKLLGGLKITTLNIELPDKLLSSARYAMKLPHCYLPLRH